MVKISITFMVAVPISVFLPVKYSTVSYGEFCFYVTQVFHIFLYPCHTWCGTRVWNMFLLPYLPLFSIFQYIYSPKTHFLVTFTPYFSAFFVPQKIFWWFFIFHYLQFFLFFPLFWLVPDFLSYNFLQKPLWLWPVLCH